MWDVGCSAQNELMSIRILHLSDTHLLAGNRLHYDRIDTTAALRQVLSRLDHLRELDYVVCSGDVSEDGSRESYAKARDILVPWAQTRGAKTLFAMGNHDVRDEFAEVLADGRFPDGEPPRGPALFSTRLHKGFRTIVLDTVVPGKGYGALGESQLADLRDELRNEAPLGTAIVMHHPPIAAQTQLLQGLALQNPDAFFDAIRGRDVRVVLAGHYHYPLLEYVDGIPVIVAGAVTNRARPLDDPAEEIMEYGSSMTLVTLSSRGIRVVPHDLHDSRSGERAFHLDAQQVDEILRVAGPR